MAVGRGRGEKNKALKNNRAETEDEFFQALLALGSWLGGICRQRIISPPQLSHNSVATYLLNCSPPFDS
jgi:hypothetical protein